LTETVRELLIEREAQAVALLEPMGPSRDLIEALTSRVWMEYITGRNVEALATADRAVAMAAELGIDVPPRLLARRGSARGELGDRGGIDDLRQATSLAMAAGLGREAVISFIFLGVYLWLWDGPPPAIEATRDGMTFARSRGLAGVARYAASALGGYLVDAGELDAAEAIESDTLREMQEAGDVTMYEDPERVLARIAALRGDGATALVMAERLPNADSDVGRLLNQAVRARILADAGDHDAARRLVHEIADPTSPQHATGGLDMRDAVAAAVAVGELEIAERLLHRELAHWP